MNNERMAGASYASIDLGNSKRISVPMETVIVEIDAHHLLNDYVRGFIREAASRNPWRAQQTELKERELMDYIDYLLTQRINYVNGNTVPWQSLKALWIPSFVQYALSLIGIVEDREYGIKLVPSMRAESKMKFSDAVVISDKLSLFDGEFDMVRDAMPRDTSGNTSVMSSAVIGDYVRSYRVTEHPIYTYVAAMLDLKLQQEAAFQSLYRFQYDDIAFIHTAISQVRKLY
jgi:hypothetical protein